MTVPVDVSSTASRFRSRRALLAGALGVLGAWATSAVGRASPVRGAGDDGAAVVVGGFYPDAQSQTTLANGANNERVLWVASNADGGGGSGTAVTGASVDGVGVEGWATGSGRGVFGHGSSGAGVLGTSGTNAGARGESGNFAGVRGTSESLYGVWGTGPHAGIYGDSISGLGVRGHSASGSGVFGSSNSGAGVFGQTTSSSAYAIRGQGRIRFDQVSGVATINAGATSRTITPNVPVTSGSFVLLTPKANIGSRALWFTTDATNDKFTIRMSSSRSSNTKSPGCCWGSAGAWP